MRSSVDGGRGGARRRMVALAILASLSLGGCVARSAYDNVVKRNEQLEQQVQTQQNELANRAAQIKRLQSAIKITVNSDLLFPPGQWEMSEAGKEILGKLVRQLAPAQENTVYVTGYTDNAPVGPDLVRAGITNNQELSKRRADSVAQFLISQGAKPELLFVQGAGETNPVAGNGTPQGRAQNRRVELTLSPPP